MLALSNIFLNIQIYRVRTKVKNLIIACIVFNLLIPGSTLSNTKLSNYRNYKVTKSEFSLIPIVMGLNYPWGMTFIDDENLLITEKSGGLLKVNITNGKTDNIKHSIKNIPYLGGGNQGGLLDVLYHKGFVYFSYSHNFSHAYEIKKSYKSCTTIARGKLVNNKIKNLEVLLFGKPKFKSNKHWGSRLVIKDDFLYASFGERGQGMIAQNPKKYPGSIIRIKLDGSIPKDNPAFVDKNNWLPEIYQIGFRNPQGMALSLDGDKIFFSQHGPRGGDNLGIVNKSGNLGWKDIAWGGKEYYGLSIGTAAFKGKYDKPIIAWVPSIGVGQINFYSGEKFKEWNGDLIVSATKTGILLRLSLRNDEVINEELILNQDIGRIRDFEIDSNGDIFIITDQKNATLWKLTK